MGMSKIYLGSQVLQQKKDFTLQEVHTKSPHREILKNIGWHGFCHISQQSKICEILGSHVGKHEDDCGSSISLFHKEIN